MPTRGARVSKAEREVVAARFGGGGAKRPRRRSESRSNGSAAQCGAAAGPATVLRGETAEARGGSAQRGDAIHGGGWGRRGCAGDFGGRGGSGERGRKAREEKGVYLAYSAK